MELPWGLLAALAFATTCAVGMVGAHRALVTRKVVTRPEHYAMEFLLLSLLVAAPVVICSGIVAGDANGAWVGGAIMWVTLSLLGLGRLDPS